MNQITKFVPITKVDKEKRMVFGWASTEDLDSDGEIIKADALERALPDYMKFPTIREMHQPKAAGKTISAEIRQNKGVKGLYIAAKIVSDEAWKLVKEGVYSAFSVGGNVLQKAENIIKEMQLIEISLVDVPANPAAVVEVWKAAKGSVVPSKARQKSASGIYRYVGLMDQIQYCMSWCDPKGKDYKQLSKMLEQVKSFIAQEANEEEPTPSQMLMSDNPKDIQKFVESLQRLSFDDKIAETIRKGVIVAMDKKAQELKEQAEKLKLEKGEEETKEVEESTEETETPKTEGAQGETSEKTDEKEEGSESSESTEETEEEEETEDKAEGDKGADATLTKINDANKRLSKITPVKESKTRTLEEKISVMADTISKMTDLVIDMNDRMDKVMKAAAPTKSKAAFVTKGQEASKEDAVDPKDAVAKTIAEKQARLEELKKLRDELGASQFAKQGYSVEAGKLQSELEILNRKSK